MTFLHGIEINSVDGGPRSIQTLRASVIGIVGTAPDADAAAFPLNKPVLVSGNRSEAANLDTVGTGLGTLPAALDGILDQGGAMVVVVRVASDADPAVELANVIGGVDVVDGSFTGVQALLGAEAATGVKPRILCAPGYTHSVVRDGALTITGAPVVTELAGIADRMRAVVIADGPNTNDADAFDYKNAVASKRVFVVDPFVQVFDTVTSTVIDEPASARVAGVIAANDEARGFWVSPSNRNINGIVGTARPVDFTLGDINSRANLLNENHVSTIIRQDGWRLWGNRTTSGDAKWAFINHVRLEDMILESLLKAHMWAVDRNITKTYADDVVEGVNAYLASLKARDAISGGECWLNTDKTTKAAMALGQVYFDFDYGRYGVAEHITFTASVNDDYTVQQVLG